MTIKYFLKMIILGLTYPIKCTSYTSLIRTFLLRPRIFDMVSFTIQFIDRKRLYNYQKKGNYKSKEEKGAVEHNLSVLKKDKVYTSRRVEPFYQIAVNPYREKINNEKLLIIGPRNRVELYQAWLYGFKWENITAIDLFSINKKIQEMNMEKMKFENNTFDTIVMVNTMAYATSVVKVLSEIGRVLKVGGVSVFNHSYVPTSILWPAEIISGQKVKDFLNKINLKIYYYDAYEKINSLNHKQTSHIFGVRKFGEDHKPFDQVNI